jgi:subtilisin family serine protease
MGPNLITVGAVDPVGNPVAFSNYGPGVAVYASAFTRARMFSGKRAIFVGTSAAAPAVVNLAAKLLAVRPDLTPQQVITFIKRGASAKICNSRW